MKTIRSGNIEVACGFDESGFGKEVELALVKERKGDEEVKIANIIDKSWKKFKWKGEEING